MTGYERLSRLIGTYPELAIYRKFSTLCAKLLLYKQAELQHLENELRIISQMDARDPKKSVYAVSWEAMNEASEEGGEDLQKQKIVEIDEKMDKYYSALLKAHQVHSFARPVDRDISFLREWLERPEGGDYSIKGVEVEPWKLCCAADLVSLSRLHGEDEFAQLLSDKILPWYHQYFGRRRRQRRPASSDDDLDNIWEYKREVFVALANMTCMVLSSVVPTAAIFALHFVKSTLARLAVITSMSFIFSFIMMVIVRGRRVEIFAATTAFAAVQVVFIDRVNIVA